MATYQSERVNFAYPAERVFTRLSDLESLGKYIKEVPADQIPAEQLAMLEQVKVTPDTISFPGGPVGDVTMRLAETKDPSLIRLEGVGTPVPVNMALHILPQTPDTCQAYVEIDLQVPAMLKPMLNGPMQKMTTQFAHMLRQMPMA